MEALLTDPLLLALTVIKTIAYARIPMAFDGRIQ